MGTMYVNCLGMENEENLILIVSIFLTKIVYYLKIQQEEGILYQNKNTSKHNKTNLKFLATESKRKQTKKNPYLLCTQNPHEYS